MSIIEFIGDAGFTIDDQRGEFGSVVEEVGRDFVAMTAVLDPFFENAPITYRAGQSDKMATTFGDLVSVAVCVGIVGD